MHNILYLTIFISFFSFQSGYGFMLIPVLLLLIIFAVMNYFNKKFKDKSARFAIGLSVTLLLCSSVYHLYQYHIERQISDSVVLKIKDYKFKNKTYPLTLNSLNIRTDINFSYHYSGDTPLLSYGSSFSAFDIFIYDFERSHWSRQVL